MVKLGVVLLVVAGMTLAGCTTKDVPAAKPGGSSAGAPASASVAASVAVPSATPDSPPPSVAPSEAPLTAPPSAAPPAPPLPPPSVTSGPLPAPVTAEETAFLARLKALSAHVADGPAAVALGHKVCDQFGAQVGYNQIADSITGYDADDARNVITAAVLTLCPQYKSQVGG